jgi:DNA-directed RNA polymerase beta' subunit
VVQSRLIGTPVNNVGRGVIIPDADLDMDEVGIPEEHAWKVYEPSLIRSLVRRGMGRVDALTHVRDRSDVARQALLAEAESGPILLSRAPVLHRFGVLALMPKLVKGDAVKTNPYIIAAISGDYDGDCVNWHVPIEHSAKQEAMEKMLPSKSLIAANDFQTPVFNVRQEFQAGLYRMTHAENKEKRARTFATMKDLHRAYLRGEIEADDPVTVMDHTTGQSGAK